MPRSYTTADTKLATYLRARHLSYERAAEELRNTTGVRCTADYLGRIARGTLEPRLALARSIVAWVRNHPAPNKQAVEIGDLVALAA